MGTVNPTQTYRLEEPKQPEGNSYSVLCDVSRVPLAASWLARVSSVRGVFFLISTQIYFYLKFDVRASTAEVKKSSGGI